MATIKTSLEVSKYAFEIIINRFPNIFEELVESMSQTHADVDTLRWSLEYDVYDDTYRLLCIWKEELPQLNQVNKFSRIWNIGSNLLEVVCTDT